jgi:hypothetical protein
VERGNGRSGLRELGPGEIAAAFDPDGGGAKMLDIQKRRVRLMLFITGVLALSMTG